MKLDITAQITEENFCDFDEDAKKRVSIIKETLLRKGDEMEVARTRIKKGISFLDLYYMLLREAGLENKYEPIIHHPSEGNEYYKLILRII